MTSEAARSFNPDRPDFEPYGLTCVQWSPSKMQRPDHHNEIELNFLKSGSVTYLLGGRKVTVEEAHLSVFWAAIPHQIIDFSGDPEYYVATIPFPWFLQMGLPDPLTKSLLAGELLAEPSGLRAALDLRLFAGWETDLAAPRTGMVASVVLEMQARLLRLSDQIPDSRGKAKSPATPKGKLNKAEQMACFVAGNYLRKLSVKEIAAAVDLHPNYAMNLFQKTIGATLVDYIIRHRISHAQRLLATTDGKINDIAKESGFHSISRFNTAFQQVCCCSPHVYRRSHRQGEETGLFSLSSP